jgi:hypothetical protein
MMPDTHCCMQILPSVGSVSDKKRTSIFERMMPNIVGKILIDSWAPNEYLKVPLERLGFIYVD